MKLMLMVATALLSLYQNAEAKMAKRQNRVWQIIDEVAAKLEIPREMFRAFIEIESGGRANARTGSYKGLGQLSREEFKKFGGKGSIYDPVENAMATGRGFKAKIEKFQNQYGHTPTAADLYMIHQQGEGGYKAHTTNPDRPAWESMYSTREGRLKGKGWAKKAIWGNLTPEARKRFGNVNNVTSGQFTQFWSGRVQKIINRHKDDPSGASASMPMPERGSRGPTSGGGAIPVEKQLPQTYRVHGDDEGPPIPTSRRAEGVKFDYRLPQGDETAAASDPGPDVPTRSPGYRPPMPGRREDEAATGGFDPVAEKAFGEPFGSLYGNGDGGMPGPIPLLKDLFKSPDVNADASSPTVNKEGWKKPMGRQLLQSLFKF